MKSKTLQGGVYVFHRQQDAQEFLRYVLEGLHDDINRVTTKHKGVDPDIDDHIDDQQKASEAWKRYLKRDNSKIVGKERLHHAGASLERDDMFFRRPLRWSVEKLPGLRKMWTLFGKVLHRLNHYFMKLLYSYHFM